MKALLISVLLLGTQAHAKTAFETLRDAFNRATTPATVRDFEEGQWQRCVFSDTTAPQGTRSTQVRTLRLSTGPGEGPLLPPNADGDRIDVFNDRSLDYNLPAFFQASMIEEDGVNFRQVLNGPPWRRMNIYGRTDSGMLLFYVEDSPHYGYYAPMHPRVYGYCWNESSRHEDEPEEEGPEEDESPDQEQPLPVPFPD